MKLISFVMVISFLFTNTAYSSQDAFSSQDTLRPKLMTKTEEGPQRLKDASAEIILDKTEPPTSGHTEPVAKAYDLAKAGRYDEAYELVMQGLLGENFVVNIETAVSVLQALVAHYGVDSEKGTELSQAVGIVTRHQGATDQNQMKAELRQAISGEEVVDAEGAGVTSKQLAKKIEAVRTLVNGGSYSSEEDPYGHSWWLITETRIKPILDELMKYLDENPSAFGRESVDAALATFADCFTKVGPNRQNVNISGRSGEAFDGYLNYITEFTAKLLSKRKDLIRSKDLLAIVNLILQGRPKELAIHRSSRDIAYGYMTGDGLGPASIDLYGPWLSRLMSRSFLLKMIAQAMAQRPSAIIDTKEKLKDLITLINETTLPEERGILIKALYPNIFRESFGPRYASYWDREIVNLIIEEREEGGPEVKSGWEPVFDLLKQKQSLDIARAQSNQMADVRVSGTTGIFSRATLMDAIKEGYILYDFESNTWISNINDCLFMDRLKGIANLASNAEVKARAEELVAKLQSADFSPKTIREAKLFMESLSERDRALYYKYYSEEMYSLSDRIRDTYGAYDEALARYAMSLGIRLRGKVDDDDYAIIEARRLLASLDATRKKRAYNISDKLYSPETVRAVMAAI